MGLKHPTAPITALAARLRHQLLDRPRPDQRRYPSVPGLVEEMNPIARSVAGLADLNPGGSLLSSAPGTI